MEILQLRYFCHAAETQNFSHTAKKFNVPASDISQCIKRLEKELGCNLFVRGKNSVILNEQGFEFYNKINKALDIIDDAKSRLSPAEEDKKITVCALTNRQLVMKATEHFHNINPEVSVSITHTYIKGDNNNLIIADGDFPFDKNRRKLLLTEKIVLAINKSNPLSKKERITIDDLKTQKFIGFDKKSSLYRTSGKIFEKLKFTPDIIIESPDPYYVRKCVELNLGVSVVPSYSWGELFNENVVFKDLWNFKRETFAYIPDEYPKKSTEQLIDIMNQFLKNGM